MKFLTLASTAATAQEILPPAAPTPPATKKPEEPKFLKFEPEIYPRFSTSSPTKRVVERLAAPPATKKPEEPKFLKVEPKIYPRFSTSSPTKRVVERLAAPAAYMPYTREAKKEEKTPMEFSVDPFPEEEEEEEEEEETMEEEVEDDKELYETPVDPITGTEEPKFLRVEPKIYPRFSTSSPIKRVIKTLITPASYKPYTQEDKKEEKKPMEIHVDPIPEEEKKEVYEASTEAVEEQVEEVESTAEVKGYEALTEAVEEHVEDESTMEEKAYEAVEEQVEEESTMEEKAYEASTSTEAAEEQDEEEEESKEGESKEKEDKEAADAKDSGSYLVCTTFATLAVIAMF